MSVNLDRIDFFHLMYLHFSENLAPVFESINLQICPVLKPSSKSSSPDHRRSSEKRRSLLSKGLEMRRGMMDLVHIFIGISIQLLVNAKRVDGYEYTFQQKQFGLDPLRSWS